MSKENKESVLTEDVADKGQADVQALVKAEMEKIKEQIRAEVRAEMQAEISELKAKDKTELAGAENKVKKLVQGMKAKLDKQPKVKIKIPIDKNNEKDLTCFAQINGFTYTMKRGEEIEVPLVVKKLLERAGTI